MPCASHSGIYTALSRTPLAVCHPLSEEFRQRYSNRMNMRDFLDRLDQRVAELDDSFPKIDQRLSIAAGLGKDTIRNWRRAARENRPYTMQTESVRKLADFLKVSEAWLIRGAGNPSDREAEDLLISLEDLDDTGRQALRDYFQFLLAKHGRERAEPPPEE